MVDFPVDHRWGNVQTKDRFVTTRDGEEGDESDDDGGDREGVVQPPTGVAAAVMSDGLAVPARLYAGKAVPASSPAATARGADEDDEDGGTRRRHAAAAVAVRIGGVEEGRRGQKTGQSRAAASTPPEKSAAALRPKRRGRGMPFLLRKGAAAASKMLTNRAGAAPLSGARTLQRPKKRAGNAFYAVVIPDGVEPGGKFGVKAGDEMVTITCPKNSGSGSRGVVRIAIDHRDDTSHYSIPNVTANRNCSQSGNVAADNYLTADGINTQMIDEIALVADLGEPNRKISGSPTSIIDHPEYSTVPRDSKLLSSHPSSEFNMFEAVVPSGTKPGSTFLVLVNDVNVLVPCPSNVVPGERVMFHVSNSGITHEKVWLWTEKAGGWARSVRTKDMKFHWIYVGDDEGDEERATLHAYVRKLHIRERDASALDLIPADDPTAATGTTVRGPSGEVAASTADVAAAAQVRSLVDRVRWFREKCYQAQGLPKGYVGESNAGHWHEVCPLHLTARRGHMLEDSLKVVYKLDKIDLCRPWKFELIDKDETGCWKSVGLVENWAQCLSEEIFAPNMGLWQRGAWGRAVMNINPSCDACPTSHLLYYHFFGCILGKALLEGQIIQKPISQHLYKFILCWPITFTDLKAVDEELYYNFESITDAALSEIDEQVQKAKALEVGLAVAKEMNEYWKHKMLGPVSKQSAELLHGFFDIIPEPLLAVFDFEELELVLHGSIV